MDFNAIVELISSLANGSTEEGDYTVYIEILKTILTYLFDLLKSANWLWLSRLNTIRYGGWYFFV